MKKMQARMYPMRSLWSVNDERTWKIAEEMTYGMKARPT